MIKQQQIVMANFCTFFQHEKRELLLNIHGKKFFWTCSKRHFPRKSTERQICNKQKGKGVIKRTRLRHFLSNNLKVRGH